MYYHSNEKTEFKPKNLFYNAHYQNPITG